MMGARVKNIVELLIGNLREKAEYKAVVKLSNSLPEDYQYVYKAIETYIYNVTFSGEIFSILMDLLESFAIASQNGKPVLAVTGKDVGAFCDDLLTKFHVKDWRDIKREELNKKIITRFKIESDE
jgi:DNA-binding ferritin-like protein (Dps family)